MIPNTVIPGNPNALTLADFDGDIIEFTLATMPESEREALRKEAAELHAVECAAVTNDDFIKARLAGRQVPAGLRPLVCTKPGNPKEGGWFPRPWPCAIDPRQNTFMVPAMFKQRANGDWRATKDDAELVLGVVLDDVGTKVPREVVDALPPTWLIETSPGPSQAGNFQAGYDFKDFISPDEADALKARLIAAGLCDPDATGGAWRWQRLPCGINGKPDYAVNGQSPRCKLVEWRPELRYTVAELVEAFDLPDAPQRAPERTKAPTVAADDGIFATAPKSAATAEHLIDQVEQPPARAEPIIEGCQQVREAGSQSEPVWHRMISVMRMCGDEGRAAIHKISAVDERRYDPDDTDKKIAQAIASQGVKGMPATCEQFDKLRPGECQKCPHWGRITSPIQLGRQAAAGAVATATVAGALMLSERPDTVPGDVLHGELFAEMFKGQLLYMHADALWLRWDGTRWRRCTQNEHMQAAKIAAKQIAKDAQARWMHNTGDTGLKVALKAAENVVSNINRLKAMVELATDHPAISIASSADLDTDPDVLGVKNGTLCLRTHKLLDTDPKRLITRSAGCAFDPAATCRQFDAVVSQAFGGDQAMIRYFWQCLGYTLTGHVTRQVYFLLFGLARSGKSVILDTIVAMMGEYAAVARSETFTRQRITNANQPRDDLACLQGARLIAVNETSASQVFDAKLINELASSGGLSVRRGFGSPFTMVPTRKLWFVGNHMPGADDASDGFWRRTRLFKFEYQIPRDQVVFDLGARIIADELPGILNRALDGLRDMPPADQDWTEPDQVRNAVDDYRKDTDTPGMWFEERIEVCPDCTVGTTELVQDFNLWANRNNEKQTNTTALGTYLSLRGFAVSKARDPETKREWRVRKGLRLKGDPFSGSTA